MHVLHGDAKFPGKIRNRQILAAKHPLDNQAVNVNRCFFAEKFSGFFTHGMNNMRTSTHCQVGISVFVTHMEKNQDMLRQKARKADALRRRMKERGIKDQDIVRFCRLTSRDAVTKWKSTKYLSWPRPLTERALEEGLSVPLGFFRKVADGISYEQALTVAPIQEADGDADSKGQPQTSIQRLGTTRIMRRVKELMGELQNMMDSSESGSREDAHLDEKLKEKNGEASLTPERRRTR